MNRDPSLNIILFGETGVGKSSVVNLIAGQGIAETSSDVQGCTMSFKPYTFTFSRKVFHIWDTVGLDEPEMGTNGYLAAISQAKELIRDLTGQGGVDLLLFCIRGNRITTTVQSNYRLFYEVLCGSKIPISLIITHLERENVMEDCWTRNQDALQKYGIKVADHACITGLPNHRKHKESREAIHRLLEGQNGSGRLNDSKRYSMPPEKWYRIFLHGLLKMFPAKKEQWDERAVLKALRDGCNLDRELVKVIVEELVQAGLLTRRE